MPARGMTSGLTLEQAIYLNENKSALKKLQDDIAKREKGAREAEAAAADAWEGFDKERADFAVALDQFKKSKSDHEANVAQRLASLEQTAEELRRKESELNSRRVELDASEESVSECVKSLNLRESGLNNREVSLDKREGELNRFEVALRDEEAALRAEREKFNREKADLSARLAGFDLND